MMKILVVEPLASRRAELVDWTCELPGVVVVGAVPYFGDAIPRLADTQIDAVLIGNFFRWERIALARAVKSRGTAIVEAGGTMDEVVAAVRALRAPAPATPSIERLEYEREARHASVQTLQYRLRNESRHDAAETIDLREWLPRTIARLRAVVPDHIELVAMVAVDTSSVRYVATILEQLVYEAVLRACAHLPWGGTVWLTAAPGKDDEVTLDVLEDGRGEIRDVRLPTSASARRS
jgi:hypothetical protein